MFYPTSFTNYADSLSTFLTCPRCRTISKCSTPWKEVKDGWADDELKTRAFFYTTANIKARVELTCPSCGTQVTLYLLCAAGGRMGETQYDAAAARWDGITINKHLASKPPVHLFADAPKELPTLRRYACVAERWYDHGWWEVNVPEEWTYERKDLPAFECAYAGTLRLGVGKKATVELPGVSREDDDREEVPPEITSPDERAAYVSARRLWGSKVELAKLPLMIPGLVVLGPRAMVAMGVAVIQHLFGSSAKLTRYQLGSLVGYWSTADEDGMSEGKGVFANGPWLLHTYLSCPTKNYEYCWGASQMILGSIRFYSAADAPPAPTA